MKKAAAALLVIITLTGCSVNTLQKQSGQNSPVPASTLPVQNQETVAQDPFNQQSTDVFGHPTANQNYYVGAIGNAKIHARFDISGTTAVGVYYYNKYKKDIKIEGTIGDEMGAELKDYQLITFYEGTDKEAEIKGMFITKDCIEGYWKSGNTIIPMYLIRDGVEAESPEPPTKEALEFDGHWTGKNSGYFGGSEANIKTLFDDLIYYDLTAFNGTATGGLSSFAVIDKNSAKTVFLEKTYNDKKENIVYELKINDKGLELNSNMYDFMCGMGASFDSSFIKGKLEIPMPSALELGIVDTAEQDNQLKKLVGDKYNDFISNTSDVNYEESKLVDLTVKAGSSYLRGASGTCFYIISSEHIYAAINWDDGVYYFTDDKRYADKLPELMIEWAGESQIFYHYKE